MAPEPRRSRNLSDEDIAAIIDAVKAHEMHCRFKSIEPDDLRDVMTTVRAFNAAMEEGKSVVRKTLLVLLIGGVVALITLGSGVRIKQLLNP